MMTWRDPLAGLLWDSREGARALRADAVARELPLERAKSIAAELSAREGQLSPQIGWKLGATDAPVQRRLGTDGPFHAPLFEATRRAPGSAVSLRQFIAPLLEAEIAIELDGTRQRARPCVEIADCRFPNWDVRLGEAIADFGLHGVALFGDGDADAEDAEVRVWRNEVEIVRGAKPIQAAREAVAGLANRLGRGLARTGSAVLIATGSVAQPVPLVAGRWTITFGRLGVLAFEVVP